MPGQGGREPGGRDLLNAFEYERPVKNGASPPARRSKKTGEELRKISHHQPSSTSKSPSTTSKPLSTTSKSPSATINPQAKKRNNTLLFLQKSAVNN